MVRTITTPRMSAAAAGTHLMVFLVGSIENATIAPRTIFSEAIVIMLLLIPIQGISRSPAVKAPATQPTAFTDQILPILRPSVLRSPV